MRNLTIIILTKNDEDVLRDAIVSAKAFEADVLVIDANKDTLSEEISKKQGVKVIRHHFKDFSDQRNFGMMHATTPWILYLDSDERVNAEFILEVNQVIKSYGDSDSIGGYFIHRRNYFYGKDWGFVDSMQRLFRRDRFVEWYGAVHETAKIKGQFGEIKTPIDHYTHRNLSQMVRKTNEWSEHEARLRLIANHPEMQPWRFIRVMATEFVRSYFNNRGYKNGTYGLIEAIYQSFSIFITYAKLWELQEASKK